MRFITSVFTRVFSSSLFLATLIAGGALALVGQQVPFHGNATGTVVDATPTSGGVLLTIHASGNATHLGHYDRVEELLLDPGTGTFTGSIVFVAANQDELHVTMTGGFISPTTAVGTYTFVGGTGRFDGATGSAAFEAVSPDGVQMTASFEGTISAVGGHP